MLHALKIIDFNRQDYFFSLELLAMSNHSFSNLFGASSSSGFGTSLPVKTWACATNNSSHSAVTSGGSTTKFPGSAVSNACATDNLSYRAVTSGDYTTKFPGSAVSNACATDNLSYKAVISNTKHTSNTTNWEDSYSSVTNKNNTSNQSSQLKKTRSHSAYPRSSNHQNSEFSQLLPVSTQFPHPEMLPKSMKNMSKKDQIVNFYPVLKKGPNYIKYCIGWLSNEEKPRSKRECIYQYTSGPNWYCTEVNMALALDSSNLYRYASYIRQLKYSIGMSEMRFTGTVFRGQHIAFILVKLIE